MFNKIQSKSSLITLLILLPVLAYGTEEDKPHNSVELYLIQSNIAIASMFDRVAESIDKFLVGKKISKLPNETTVGVQNISNSTEGKKVENITHLNVNLRLPNLENYFQLKFTTYDQNEERSNQIKYGPTTTKQRNYGASVGWFKSFGNINTVFQPRIDLQDPLKVSHSLAFSSKANFKTYEVKPKVEFFATPDKGTGIFLAGNYAYFISELLTLNWINEGEYEEKRNLFSTNLGLSLAQAVNKTSSLSYNVFFNSNSRPVYHLNGYSFGITWSQQLYKKIFDYQITPHLDFSTESSFKGAAGLTIALNLNF